MLIWGKSQGGGPLGPPPSCAATDAIVTLAADANSKVSSAFLITKKITDYGVSRHETSTPILRLPALIFLYLLGKIEAEGNNAKM
jgi:hypothetical protein